MELNLIGMDYQQMGCSSTLSTVLLVDELIVIETVKFKLFSIECLESLQCFYRTVVNYTVVYS
jgi:hypothetical protein